MLLKGEVMIIILESPGSQFKKSTLKFAVFDDSQTQKVDPL